MTKYKNIFFDLDGTITDPEEGIVNSYIYSLEKLGIKNCDRELIAKYIGPSIHLVFVKEYGIPESDIDIAVKYYREHFGVKGIYENKVYEGIPELLESLMNTNRNVYLVTSKPTVYAKEILRHFNLEKYFIKVYGSEMSNKNTDKETLIREALTKSNLNNSECLMIGDRMYDTIGANANNVDSVAVTYGFGRAEEFAEHNPAYIVNSVQELEKLLMSVSGPQS